MSPRSAIPVLMAAVCSMAGRAQPVPAGPVPRDVLVSTQFTTPLTYEAALARLDEYYDQEVGRKGAAAFPPIGPRRHFELWHDLWVAFDAADGGVADRAIRVTIKRQADGSTSRLVKGWMLNLAGRLEAPVPLVFKDEPALHAMEGDLYASTRDIAQALAADASLKTLPTWEHTGLIVSASPMTSITLAAAGLHGSHHVTVITESAAAAKLLWGRIAQGILK